MPTITNPATAMNSQRVRRRCITCAGEEEATLASILVRALVTATPRPDEISTGREAARLNFGDQCLRQKHLVLGRQHAEVVIEPCAVALTREIVGVLRCLECDPGVRGHLV